MTIATIIVLALFIFAPILLTLLQKWILPRRAREMALDQQTPSDESAPAEPLSQAEIENALRSMVYPRAEVTRPEASTRKQSALTGTNWEKSGVKRSAGAFPRLQALPPLKRAVVWSEILGPPGGREPQV